MWCKSPTQSIGRATPPPLSPPTRRATTRSPLPITATTTSSVGSRATVNLVKRSISTCFVLLRWVPLLLHHPHLRLRLPRYPRLMLVRQLHYMPCVGVLVILWWLWLFLQHLFEAFLEGLCFWGVSMGLYIGKGSWGNCGGLHFFDTRAFVLCTRNNNNCILLNIGFLLVGIIWLE